MNARNGLAGCGAVVISDVRHSVCDMMSGPLAARGRTSYNKDNNNHNKYNNTNNNKYNNCNSSRRIASIANTMSNDTTKTNSRCHINTTTTTTTSTSTTNTLGSRRSSPMNALAELSRRSRLPSAARGMRHFAAGATANDEWRQQRRRRRLCRRQDGPTVAQTANKHKLPLRPNRKATAAMPASTTYYITLLLAAVILGTDLAGSETDILARPPHESAASTLAIDMNTIEMPMPPPLKPSSYISGLTTETSTWPTPNTDPTGKPPRSMTIAGVIADETLAQSSSPPTTIMSKGNQSASALTPSQPNDDAANTGSLNATTGTPSPPTAQSLASLEDIDTQYTRDDHANDDDGGGGGGIQRMSVVDSAELVVTDSDGLVLARPPADILTHGFSIPTYLPPFPEFDVADLPAYAAAASTSTTTTTSTEMPLDLAAFELGEDGTMHSQDQMYMNALSRQQMRRNSTMPAINVTVQMGNHAYLPCNIRRFMNKPVSWVRVRDGHILSVDQTPFIADQRFQSIFKGENEYTWSLQIKYVQDTDAGWYECQVSTEPKMSAKVLLTVVVPITELIGDQNRFVKAGSKVALHCIVRGTLEPPSYIIWFRGKSQITDDNKMGWYTQIDRTIFGNVSDNQNTIGSLIIPSVRKKDSGNYTCQPSNSQSVSVDLHVLSGEYSASAIMSGAHHLQLNANYFIDILILMAMYAT